MARCAIFFFGLNYSGVDNCPGLSKVNETNFWILLATGDTKLPWLNPFFFRRPGVWQGNTRTPQPCTPGFSPDVAYRFGRHWRRGCTSRSLPSVQARRKCVEPMAATTSQMWYDQQSDGFKSMCKQPYWSYGSSARGQMSKKKKWDDTDQRARSIDEPRKRYSGKLATLHNGTLVPCHVAPWHLQGRVDGGIAVGLRLWPLAGSSGEWHCRTQNAVVQGHDSRVIHHGYEDPG